MRLKLTALIATVALISGCGTPSKEERLKSFDTKINKLKSEGFDIAKLSQNKDKISYVITAKDKKKVSNYILSMVNMQTLPPKFKNSLASSIDKVGVDVDLKKLAENKENSTFVYLLDNNKTQDKDFKKLLANKAIGAYITYNKENQIKKIKAKNLDFVDKSSHITLTDLIVDFQKPANDKDDSKEFTLTLKSAKLDDTKNKYASGVAYINNLNCHITKENLIIGSYDCKVNEINFDLTKKTTSQKTLLSLKNINLNGSSKESGDNITSDVKFALDNLHLSANGYKTTDILLSNYKIAFNGFAFDKKSLNNMVALIKKGITKPEVFKEYLNETAKIYENASMKGNSSFDKLKIDAKRGKYQEAKFEVENYKGDFDAKMTKVIDYISHTTMGTLRLTNNNPRTPIDLTLNGYNDTFKLNSIYNFMPTMIRNLKPNADPRSAAYRKQEQEMFAKIGQNILHNGGGITFSPITVNSISIKAGSKTLNFKKLDLGVSAKLKENKIVLDNPALLKAQLLKNSDINAHIVLSKDDFQTVSKLLPPTAMMMIGAFVKYDNGNAVFKLKSKDGHLYLNEKPVM